MNGKNYPLFADSTQNDHSFQYFEARVLITSGQLVTKLDSQLPANSGHCREFLVGALAT